mmetsp:Transcript_6154/g.9902  ORF Transcript_6154/g.9902 Transcript_6154/m.9902 type:complete len:319 (+) Transcript_6154:1112-2068(+)|eukprot:CAMPEP_0170502834 /NCGR_PEP_ID=MMETSP0208-20121228/42685_1 /TAXON_ID=197538 /ORGANISM="Strombidium inclinatum, Strain S3" /LENGTH=318 /DNA_ID=CAMNT_0010782133 /DNA_START=1032 /DNA_END=1988 /DNA_ORIENTATION=+
MRVELVDSLERAPNHGFEEEQGLDVYLSNFVEEPSVDYAEQSNYDSFAVVGVLDTFQVKLFELLSDLKDSLTPVLPLRRHQVADKIFGEGGYKSVDHLSIARVETLKVELPCSIRWVHLQALPECGSLPGAFALIKSRDRAFVGAASNIDSEEPLLIRIVWIFLFLLSQASTTKTSTDHSNIVEAHVIDSRRRACSPWRGSQRGLPDILAIEALNDYVFVGDWVRVVYRIVESNNLGRTVMQVVVLILHLLLGAESLLSFKRVKEAMGAVSFVAACSDSLEFVVESVHHLCVHVGLSDEVELDLVVGDLKLHDPIEHS